jgi:hypothetical protein
MCELLLVSRRVTVTLPEPLPGAKRAPGTGTTDAMSTTNAKPGRFRR